MRESLVGLAWFAIGLVCLAMVLAGCAMSAPTAESGAPEFEHGMAPRGYVVSV